jgi:hypothetical protein
LLKSRLKNEINVQKSYEGCLTHDSAIFVGQVTQVFFR